RTTGAASLESRQLHHALRLGGGDLLDEHVRGVQLAVNDALLMGVGERVGQLVGDVGDRGEGERTDAVLLPAPPDAVERFSLDVLQQHARSEGRVLYPGVAA